MFIAREYLSKTYVYILEKNLININIIEIHNTTA